MKKITLILIIAIIAVSCGSSDQSTQKQSQNVTKDHKVSVKATTLSPQKFKHFIELTGIIEAENIAFISSEIPGQIKEIYVKEGDRVKKDQILARLNTEVLKTQVEELETRLELAQIVFVKQENLWKQSIGSEIEYLTAKNNKESLERNLETVKANLELAFVKAPFDGIIDDIIMKVGELASPGVQIMQLVNLNDLYINADLAETYLAAVNKGDQVELSFSAYPSLQMTKPIHRIGNIIHQMNRTVNIQIKLKNKKEMLKPNGLAVIKINDFSSEDAIIVPSIIIKQDQKGSFLYVAVKKNNQFVAQKRYITVGRSYQENSMIDEGLSAGEQIITVGFTQIADGSILNITK